MAGESSTVEIRFHGRGGQGVVTASKLLAEAAMKEGKYFQALPEYGAERMGAPIRAYIRISSAPIVPHCQVTQPNVVVGIDPTLIGTVDMTAGMTEGGMLVVNSTLSPAEIREKLNYRRGTVCTVDATGISIEAMGRNFPNIPMLGALVKGDAIVSKDALVSMIRYKLGSTMLPEVVEGNVKAFEKAWERAQLD